MRRGIGRPVFRVSSQTDIFFWTLLMSPPAASAFTRVRPLRWKIFWLLCGLAWTGMAPAGLWAQGGPPLLTDDPGTPGNRNWEINLACTQNFTHDQHTYETPILDLNYGLGDRIQLKYQIPYLLVSNDGGPLASGMGNSLAGVKWRFYQDEAKGWNVSTYPQLELNNPGASLRRGLVDKAPNFLLPIEVTKRVGSFELNWEAGYWFSRHLADGRVLGFAAGHQTTKRLELLTEVYDFVEVGTKARDDTFDFGGRFEFHHDILLLFMAGRGFSGPPSEQSRFIGYFGVQFQINRTHHNPDPEVLP
jgi:hypothetical protein